MYMIWNILFVCLREYIDNHVTKDALQNPSVSFVRRWRVGNIDRNYWCEMYKTNKLILYSQEYVLYYPSFHIHTLYPNTIPYLQHIWCHYNKNRNLCVMQKAWCYVNSIFIPSHEHRLYLWSILGGDKKKGKLGIVQNIIWFNGSGNRDLNHRMGITSFSMDNVFYSLFDKKWNQWKVVDWNFKCMLRFSITSEVLFSFKFISTGILGFQIIMFKRFKKRVKSSSHSKLAL